ncbi:MAG TPA: hypothetical protein VE913_01015 [Longimicrobium sp.]|nr:hypothetical protein [Longimicrobium sp.]
MNGSTRPRHRTIAALLTALLLGGSVIPGPAAAQGYCVWTVITTTYRDRATGVVLLVEQEATLDYCCPGSYECNIRET